MRRSLNLARGFSLRQRLSDESGIALVMALGVMLVLTIVLTTVITFTAAGARDSHRVNAGQKATALAEAGLNNALAVLNQNYPATPTAATPAYPGNPALLPSRTTAYPTGNATWGGTLEISPLGAQWADEWRITSTGSVANPTGPGAAPVTRTVRAVVPIIVPATVPVTGQSPLNFIYAFNDVTFLQSVVVASPVYATDDLVLQNTSTISEKAGKIGVEGDVYLTSPQNRIGHVNGSSAGAPPVGNEVPQIHIEGECSSQANPTLHNCNWGDPDKIWSVTENNSIPLGFLSYIPQLTCCGPYPTNPNLTPVVASDSDMGLAYRNADLGPRRQCLTGSTPFTFDGAGGPDNLINNSATPTGSTPIDLTPNASYTCKSARGELSWNNATKILTVDRTVFIDGSITISSPTSDEATYVGKGVIYATGTFSMKNTLLCVKTTGSGNNAKCDTLDGAWDPDVGALFIIADGDGGYDSTQSQGNNVESGEGIKLKGASFQGALIANKEIDIDTTSSMQGPMLSVYASVYAGQSNVLTFPSIYFPASGTSNVAGPPPTPQLLPPQQFGGG